LMNYGLAGCYCQ